jgi:hypothetical protein
MANQPRADNPHRSVRVEDALWEEARIAAAKEGTTRGDVMRQALRELVERSGQPDHPARRPSR